MSISNITNTFFIQIQELIQKKNASTLHDSNQKNVLKIAPETIAYVNKSLDERRTNVISYLHKAFRALNQVRMLDMPQSSIA